MILPDAPALKVFRSQEPYMHASKVEEERYFHMPLTLGRLVHYAMPGGCEVAFTWTRPASDETVLRLIDGEPPSWGMWQDFGGERVWIVDLAATPGVSGLKVGRFLRWALVEEEIAHDGELCLFRRSSGSLHGRIGSLVARR